MASKTSQNNAQLKKTIKRAPVKKRDPLAWALIYKDVFDSDEQASIPFLKQLALDLMEWASSKHDDCTIVDFIGPRKIGRRKYEKWVAKHDFLNDAHDYALMMLGAKRERKGLENDWNTVIVTKSLHMYNPEWQRSEEWRSSLKAIPEPQKQDYGMLSLEMADGIIIKLNHNDKEQDVKRNSESNILPGPSATGESD